MTAAHTTYSSTATTPPPYPCTHKWVPGHGISLGRPQEWKLIRIVHQHANKNKHQTQNLNKELRNMIEVLIVLLLYGKYKMADITYFPLHKQLYEWVKMAYIYNNCQIKTTDIPWTLSHLVKETCLGLLRMITAGDRTSDLFINLTAFTNQATCPIYKQQQFYGKNNSIFWFTRTYCLIFGKIKNSLQFQWLPFPIITAGIPQCLCTAIHQCQGHHHTPWDCTVISSILWKHNTILDELLIINPGGSSL